MRRFLHSMTVIARKEVLHILRDRLTLALLLTVPLLQMLLFGYAIDLHPKHLPTALVAFENDVFVDQAVQQLEADGYFDVVVRTTERTRADRLLAESRVQFVLELPQGFGQKILSGKPPQVTLIADATDPVATVAATQAAATRYSRSMVTQSPVMLVIERRFNAVKVSRQFVVPGLLGVVLTLTLVLLAAFCVVRERERGTADMLRMLPIGSAAMVLGKLAPYFF